MFRIQRSLVRNAALAGFIALGLTSTAIAQTAAPATGLGQAWPNAADVSASPNWHVYVFRLHGIKYIQINDLSGTVHTAIGTANGTTIVLPVGVDAQNVKTAAAAASSTAEVVYSDASTTVTATSQSSGATTFSVAQTEACPQADCSGPGAQ
jgi:hypothetical protein